MKKKSPMFVVSHLARQENNMPQTTFEALRTGTLHDRGLVFTMDMLNAYVANFKAKSYNGCSIFINLNHTTGTDSAGEITDVFVEGESLMLTVDWTELGIEKISKKLYNYVSVEVISEMPHWETGKPVQNVLRGAALTNDPALGGQQALQLEKFSQSFHNPSNMDAFKVFLENLSKQDSVLAAHKKVLTDMFETLSEDEKEEVKTDVEAVEAKPEPETDEETPEEKAAREAEEAKAKADEEAKAQELKKKTTEATDLAKRVEALEKDKADLLAKARANDLNKKVEALVFNKETEKGFLPAAKDDLSTFLNSLTDAQVENFEKLMTKYQALNMEDVGLDGDTPADSDEAVVEKAQELAKKEGITFREALRRVTAD